MAERKTLKIAVTEDADAIVSAIGEREGMTKQELASRIYIWFSEQPEILQGWILGRFDRLPETLRHPAIEEIASYFQTMRADKP